MHAKYTGRTEHESLERVLLEEMPTGHHETWLRKLTMEQANHFGVARPAMVGGDEHAVAGRQRVADFLFTVKLGRHHTVGLLNTAGHPIAQGPRPKRRRHGRDELIWLGDDDVLHRLTEKAMIRTT
jgi:hypothetical protein